MWTLSTDEFQNLFPNPPEQQNAQDEDSASVHKVLGDFNFFRQLEMPGMYGFESSRPRHHQQKRPCPGTVNPDRKRIKTSGKDSRRETGSGCSTDYRYERKGPDRRTGNRESLVQVSPKAVDHPQTLAQKSSLIIESLNQTGKSFVRGETGDSMTQRNPRNPSRNHFSEDKQRKCQEFDQKPAQQIFKSRPSNQRRSDELERRQDLKTQEASNNHSTSIVNKDSLVVEVKEVYSNNNQSQPRILPESKSSSHHHQTKAGSSEIRNSTNHSMRTDRKNLEIRKNRNQNSKHELHSKEIETSEAFKKSKSLEIKTSRNVETRVPFSQSGSKPQEAKRSVESIEDKKQVKHRKLEEDEEVPQQIDPAVFKKMKELEKQKKEKMKENKKDHRKVSESSKSRVAKDSRYSSSSMHRQTSFSVIGRRQQTGETTQQLSAQNFLALRRENRKSFL